MHIGIIDRDEGRLHHILERLYGEEFSFTTLDKDNLVASIQSLAPALSLVITELLLRNLPLHDNEGLQVISLLKRQLPSLPVMLISASLSVPTAMDATRKRGADDAYPLGLLFKRGPEGLAERIRKFAPTQV